MLRIKPFLVFLILVLTTLFAPLIPLRSAFAQDQLLFCNRPEKMTAPGTHADTMLVSGRTYTIFFHYKNATRNRGNLVVALSGDAKSPLSFVARRGFGDAQSDPTLAGRQAMARFFVVSHLCLYR